MAEDGKSAAWIEAFAVIVAALTAAGAAIWTKPSVREFRRKSASEP